MSTAYGVSASAPVLVQPYYSAPANGIQYIQPRTEGHSVYTAAPTYPYTFDPLINSVNTVHGLGHVPAIDGDQAPTQLHTMGYIQPQLCM